MPKQAKSVQSARIRPDLPHLQSVYLSRRTEARLNHAVCEYKKRIWRTRLVRFTLILTVSAAIILLASLL